MTQRASQKAESRSAILTTAAGLVREQGTEGTSVQKAMNGAGLTVGAFYAHFDDKADLVEQAYELALTEMTAIVLDAGADRTGVAALKPVIEQYLSDEHRDHPSRGCPLPALLGEAAHPDSPIPPPALAHGFETLRDALCTVDGDLTESQASALLALLIGSQIVARATEGTTLSEAVLTAARAHAPDIATPAPERTKRTAPPTR
jgi:TetR/AcrR family transcriptional repressor of nem operon